jgi:type II secretory pathway pseudopilin PulG
MDSGTAVIIGAIIALASSSLIPWIREHVTQKAQRDREYRQELRSAARDALRALGEAHFPRTSPITTENAITNMDRLFNMSSVVRPEDAPVARVVVMASAGVASKNSLDSAAAYNAILDLLGTWLREGIDTNELVGAYKRQYQEIRTRLEDEDNLSDP